MKGILTFTVFILMISGVGGPIIMFGFLILGYISDQENIAYLDLPWYYHLGFLVAIIVLLKNMFKSSQRISGFIVSLFS